MPNCFTLTRKGQNEAEPLQKIDEELCTLLNRPVHPKWWVVGWYDNVGFQLAMGKSWNQIRCQVARDQMADYAWQDQDSYDMTMDLLRIITYLENNFLVNSWVEIGRRN